MISIEESLNRLFKYERNQSPLMAALVVQGYKTKGVAHLNLAVQNEEYGFSGVIPFAGEVDKKRGFAMGYYTAEKELSRDGNKLPAPFDAYNDCPYIHLGVLVNCLSLMSRHRFTELIVINCNNNDLITMMEKPTIAEQFMAYLSPAKRAEQAKKQQAKKGFDPSQVSLFR